jgi:amphi-Trp domain-containing protein
MLLVNRLYRVSRGTLEDTLFEVERNMDTVEVARYLRTVADHRESGGEVTLESGTGSVTLTLPRRAEFKNERETSKTGGSAERELWFELERDEDGTGTGDLDIG